MIKHLLPFSLRLFFAALIAPVLLVGCGEGTNLKDPKEIVSTTDCSELATANNSITCVPGYFVDDVVENLNYSCGKVNSVTDVAGKFSCPSGSKVEFSILNPDDSSSTAKKIVLGSLTVKNLPKIYSKDAALYITPMSFGSQSAKNITRLLQTLREPDSVTDDGSAGRTIKLLDADKRKLASLSASIAASNFSLADPVAFEGLFSAYLSAVNKPMILESRAEYFLKKGIHSTVAGAYSVPGYLVTFGYRPSGSNNFGAGDLGGIRGLDNTNYFLAATWNMVDRKGRITGFGVYSTAANAAVTPDTCKSLLPAATCTSAPARNGMSQKNPSGLSWTPWDTVAGKWSLSYDLLNAAGTPSSPANIFSFSQGAIDRGAIAGTPYLYSQIYGESVAANSSLLGKWSITGAPNFSAVDTSYTITRTRVVAPTLDPGFWGALTFPLKVRMNFLKADKASSIGVLKVLILEDGNIVSNIQNKCDVVSLDRETLTYPDLSKEFPLGTVAQIFSANNDAGTRRYIAPILLIPDDVTFAGLRNIQIGIATGGSSGVRLRVDTGNSSAYLRLYADTEYDSSGSARDQDSSAEWLNVTAAFNSSVTSGINGYVTTQADTDACI